MEEDVFKKLKDIELLERYRLTGDQRYFQEIFGRYRQKIQGACRRFFRGNPNLAEDATQDTFLKALQSSGQGPVQNVGGWLLKVARNSCIDIHRKERTAIFQPYSETDSSTGLSENNKETQNRETRIIEVIRKVNELGTKQRISLKLYLEGFSYEEIARLTQYSEKEVKSAIQTGKEHLKKFFQS